MRRRLEKVVKERAALDARNEAHREAIYRFLTRHRAAPPGGKADVDALAAGLARVEDRLTPGAANDEEAG